MSEELDHKKELAKLKRMATEVASQIHDIVEDTLWTDYVKMPELSQQLFEAVKAANDYKKAHSL
jgi:hypothetical protein